MDKRYIPFAQSYARARKRWTGEEPDIEKLDPYKPWRLSLLCEDGQPGSSIAVMPSEKAVAFKAEDEDGYLQEIWREEYEDLQEIEDSWFKLSKEELEATHRIESEAFFGEFDDE